MSDTTLVVLVALAMAVGVAGTVVPLVPGLGLVWLAALAYGLVDGFGVVGSIVFVTISAMAVAGIVAGIAVPHHAARGGGAAQWSIALGAATAIVGFFVIPIVGMALGGVLGIFVGEALRNTRRHDGVACDRRDAQGLRHRRPRPVHGWSSDGVRLGGVGGRWLSSTCRRITAGTVATRLTTSTLGYERAQRRLRFEGAHR